MCIRIFETRFTAFLIAVFHVVLPFFLLFQIVEGPVIIISKMVCEADVETHGLRGSTEPRLEPERDEMGCEESRDLGGIPCRECNDLASSPSNEGVTE